MTSDIVKEGVKLAEEELRKEEVTRIKDVVKATLEKLHQKEIQKHGLEEEIKILRKDVEDLKEGRIDRIKERQEVDSKAKDVSVIIIKEKIIERQVPTWYYPWIIEIKREYVPWIPWPYFTVTNSGNATITGGSTSSAVATSSNATSSSISFTTNNSMAHLHVSGTYQLSDGTVKYI